MEWRGWIAGSWVDLGDESGVDWKAVKSLDSVGRGGGNALISEVEEGGEMQGFWCSQVLSQVRPKVLEGGADVWFYQGCLGAERACGI